MNGHYALQTNSTFALEPTLGDVAINHKTMCSMLHADDVHAISVVFNLSGSIIHELLELEGSSQ